VEIDRVLLISSGDEVKVGTPNVTGARVLATAKAEGRDRKVVVLKYKPKSRYRKKTGHRQHYTELVIDEIIGLGESPDKPVPRTRRSKPEEETESGA
jgi:large subunit ribosomal protein L21